MCSKFPYSIQHQRYHIINSCVLQKNSSQNVAYTMYMYFKQLKGELCNVTFAKEIKEIISERNNGNYRFLGFMFY